jgi:hypothetical protein
LGFSSLRAVQEEAGLDLDCVRDNLGLIAERRYACGQDLPAKLATLLDAAS